MTEGGDRLTVACVYRKGGIYDPDWVWSLRRQLEIHLPPHDFVVLTDSVEIPYSWVRPLQYSWRGWWSKFELFRPGLFRGPVLYFDLDSLIVGYPEVAEYRGDLALILDVGGHGRPQTGIMAFTPGEKTERVWDLWMENPDRTMREIRGDGEWFMYQVLQFKTLEVDYIQELYPDQVHSWKYHCVDGPLPSTRVVCGHGEPRFSDPKTGWAHQYWKGDLREPKRSESPRGLRDRPRRSQR